MAQVIQLLAQVIQLSKPLGTFSDPEGVFSPHRHSAVMVKHGTSVTTDYPLSLWDQLSQEVPTVSTGRS